jgi:dienelactone hydrolase
MFEPRRWPREAWIPIIAGLLWLWHAASFGVVGFFFSLIPGCLLLSSGVSSLLYPGDLRIPQFTALGGVLGVPLAVPAFFDAGAWPALALILLSAASFVSAGMLSVAQEPHTEEVPTPLRSLGVAAQVAIDDAILASMALRLPSVMGTEHERVLREVHEARQLFGDRGWLEHPAEYHETPPPLTDPRIRKAKVFNLEYEHIEFESAYEPRTVEPGRDRWLSRIANRTAHAWVLRHTAEPRPWLICIHGYEMGLPGLDLLAFRAARLHSEYGLNVALPVLPLHGPRRYGRSGEGFLAGEFLDTIHAEAQAMWDIRRLLSWIRRQSPPRVGVYGLSLGGYNTAMLASLESDLACAIAGIPATDFSRLAWRHGARLQILYAERRGLVHDEVSQVMRVVSPLALRPQVPKERRFLFAGVADRLVPAEQVRDLWRHWDRPRIVWYQGAHLTFRMHPEVNRLLRDALRECNLVGWVRADSATADVPVPPADTDVVHSEPS